jgi:hypothetical protein
MPRLVTGVFYGRREAERAVEALKTQGLSEADIFLEREVTPSPEAGRKGGEVSRLEKERRFAGLETGLVIGVTVGLLAGLGIGILGSAMAEMMHAGADVPVLRLSPWLVAPTLSALAGALIGLLAGGVIGYIIDFTLNRLGAGPPLPREETLVTVRTDEDRVDQVSALLFRARARHLHVAESAPA